MRKYQFDILETRKMESREVIAHIKDLEKNKSNDKLVLEILQKLDSQIKPTEKLLRETKIGIEVNKFKKSNNAKISSQVKKMINSWKDAINKQKKMKLLHQQQQNANKDDTNSTNVNKSSSNTPEPVKGSVNMKPRNARIDGVNTNIYNDKLRDMVVKALYDALVKESNESSEKVLNISTSIEIELKKLNDPSTNEKAYKDKYRVVYSNLISRNNPTLKTSIVSGQISPQKLVTCDPKELAPESLKKELDEIARKNLFNAQGATIERSVTDRFTCGKCKEKKVSYYQLQTRSADEPLTTFCTCEACGNRWKFS